MEYRDKPTKYASIILAGLIGCAASTMTYADASSANTKKADTTNQAESAQASEPVADDVLATDDDLTTFDRDPLERFNRAIFAFNDVLDIYLVKPIAKFYNAAMPKPLNTGIHNFFTNISELNNIANDILQLNVWQMANDAWRFGINSTFGLAGLVDMATRMRLPYKQNDFGLTLSRWGYQNSTYLVLPFIGPSTFRDGVGLSVDYFAFSPYPRIKPDSTRYQVLGLFYLDHRANLLDIEPVLEEAAIDKYVFMRNAYMQHRTFQIEQVSSREASEPVAETN